LAQQLEVQVPRDANHCMALVTATHPDAPPILHWDREDARNPVSWYYASGIDADLRQRVAQAGGRIVGVDIRASLGWQNRNDLDLHAITPAGDHVWYAELHGCRYGGYLDVDMNVHGESMNPVENMRWANGQAREGRYQFYVNLYATHRGYPEQTPFRVELEVNGQSYTVQGETRYLNNHNALDRMVKVADFFYTNEGGPRESTLALTRTAVSPNLWGLTPDTYVPVTAVVPSPNLWGEHPSSHNGQHVFFLLDGCRDTQQGVGRGFMAEMLKSDLHAVRSVLTAYAAQAIIDGAETASACGIGISNEGTGDLVVKVRTAAGATLYQIDRWD
jgi:hypothetical protein